MVRINKSIFCLIISLSMTSAWSSERTWSSERIEDNQSAVKMTFGERGDLSVLPNVIMKKIMQYQGVAKALGNVCKDLEKLRCEKEIPLQHVITEAGNFDSIRFFKSGLKFKYTPDEKTLKSISSFQNLLYVSLTGTDVEDVSTLGNVHTLDLTGTKVTDVSTLGKVHTLNLCGTKVQDVSALGKVHTLNLSGTDVEDVSALGNVHTLNLSETKVTNVSALGNVHTLNLRVTDVKDVSALGNVHTLSLSDTDVKDVSALGGVNTLRIDSDKLIGFEKLKTVKNLYVGYKEYNWPSI